MSRFLVLIVLPLLLLIGGCAAPKNSSIPAAATSVNSPKMWMVSNGFHTSIAVRAKDAPAELQAMDRKAHYFVIGWGGRNFYMADVNYPWDYVRVTFFPMASTLHVIPVRTELLKEFPLAEIVEFEVKTSGLEKLRGRLAGDFQRDARDHFIVDGPGRLPRSRFYSGSEIYFIPKTCNMWAASHLKLAGVAITPAAAISAGNLCWQGERQGRVLAPLRHPREVL